MRFEPSWGPVVGLSMAFLCACTSQNTFGGATDGTDTEVASTEQGAETDEGQASAATSTGMATTGSGPGDPTGGSETGSPASSGTSGTSGSGGSGGSGEPGPVATGCDEPCACPDGLMCLNWIGYECIEDGTGDGCEQIELVCNRRCFEPILDCESDGCFCVPIEACTVGLGSICDTESIIECDTALD